MTIRQFPSTLPALLVLAACSGADTENPATPQVDPLTKNQVIELLTDNTVTMPFAADSSGVLPKPSGRRYLYHQRNGLLFFLIDFDNENVVAQDTKGRGFWEPSDDKVCYTFGDAYQRGEPDACYTISGGHGQLEIAEGDVLSLMPKARVAPNCPTGLEKGCDYSWLPIIVGAYYGVGKAVEIVCSRGDCSDGAEGSGRTSNTERTPARTSQASTSSSRGVSSVEPFGRSPDGKETQYKITCTSGAAWRYWEQNGEWYGPSGAAGFRGLSIAELAQRRCG